MLTRNVCSIVVLTALIAVACGKSPREKSFRTVLPVAQLGVKIGMSEKTVRRVRPQATFGPYLGLVEEIGQDGATYAFPGTGDRNVPMFAKLSRVVYSKTFGDSTEALAIARNDE